MVEREKAFKERERSSTFPFGFLLLCYDRLFFEKDQKKTVSFREKRTKNVVL